MTSWTSSFDSPLGPLGIVVDDRGRLVRIDLPDPSGARPAPPSGLPEAADRGAHVARQLADYFAGRRTQFDLELALAGTAFQLAAWAALAAIPYGQTVSYQQQARWLGRPAATRAVGAANGRNPIPIVVPCHRVVGKDGRLVGFGGGLPCKRWLLQHETAVLARNAALHHA